MEPSSSTTASASTRAISIPLHGNVSAFNYRPGHHSSRRRAAQARRVLKVEHADPEAGHVSSSSLGSDWTSSPTSGSATQSADRHRLSLQTSVASPSDGALDLMTPPNRHQKKDKQRALSNDLPPPNTLPPLFAPSQSPLGPSMLSSSAYKSVNLNTRHDPDSKEPPRLITYTKHSQGFTWNDELFLPSYLLGRHRYRDYSGRSARRRWGGHHDDDDDDDDDRMGGFEEEGERCPVTDIFVTDEEADAMMP